MSGPGGGSLNTESGRVYESSLSVQDKLYFLHKITQRVHDEDATQDAQDPDSQYANIRRNEHDAAVASGFIERLKRVFGNNDEFDAMLLRVRAYRFQPTGSNPLWDRMDASDEEDDEEMATAPAPQGTLFGDVLDSDDEEEVYKPRYTHPDGHLDDQTFVARAIRRHDNMHRELGGMTRRLDEILRRQAVDEDGDDTNMSTAVEPAATAPLSDEEDEEEDMVDESRKTWIHLAASHYGFNSVSDYEDNHHPSSQLDDPQLAAEFHGHTSVREYMTRVLGQSRVNKLDALATRHSGVRRRREDEDSDRPRTVRRLDVNIVGDDDDEGTRMSNTVSFSSSRAQASSNVLSVIDGEGDPDMISASFGPGNVIVECAFGYCSRMGPTSAFISFQAIDNQQGSHMQTPDGLMTRHALVFYCPRHAPHGRTRRS